MWTESSSGGVASSRHRSLTLQENPIRTEAEQRAQLANLWRFNWPVMGVMIGGESSIDLPTLTLKTREEAAKFLKSYGFDSDQPDDARQIHAVIVEALSFIERHLMPKEWGQGLMPPAEVLACEDARDLLVWASDREESNRQRRIWSCAVLRVMHTIGHIEGAFRYTSIDQARIQIMDRFNVHVQRDHEGVLWLGPSDMRVRLARIEWKYSKPRESILLKLLHKRANVAETIYDVIGVRIITERQCDVMLAVKILSHLHIVSFPNCNPSRARNTLLDPDAFRMATDDLRGKLMSNSITPDEFERAMQNLVLQPPDSNSSNPHSAMSYRSIQMTGRQLIRTENPNFGWLRKLESEAAAVSPEKSAVLKDLVNFIRGWNGVEDELCDRAFFPFEIQVMDSASYALNSSGPASHGKYKRKQVRAARRRVLGDILQIN
jgi:uncharacterized protein (TIGR04562 family)